MDIILERDFDVIGVSECDIQDFDPKRPFKWTGYRTFFLMERDGCDKKRLLCFVKSTIEVKERTDLMSDKLSNVWIEIQGKHQKILICTAYREFSYIVTPRQMSGTIHVPIQGPLRTPKEHFLNARMLLKIRASVSQIF